MKHDLQTRHTPLAELHQHPSNPRNGDVSLIAESLATNGQYKPIVAAVDGTILAGNHTYQAALSLGWASLGTVTLDLDPHGAAAKRIMLADNRTSDVSATMYDDPALINLLSEVGPDLEGTGFSTRDLDDLMALDEYRAQRAVGATFADASGAGLAASTDGSVQTQPIAERITAWDEKDARSLILPYPSPEYADLIAQLATARDKAGVTTNAAVVRTAITAYIAS